MTGSIRGRLARTLGLTAAISVAVTALITFGLVRRYAGQAAIEDLRQRGEAIAKEAEGIQLREAAALRRLLQASGDQVAFVGPRGTIQSQDPAARRVAQLIPVRRVLEGETLTGTVSTTDGTFAYAAVPVASARALSTAVVLARPVALAQDVWKPIAIRVLIAAGLAALIAVVLSGAFAERLTRRVRHVADAAAGIAAGDLHARVPVEGGDEIADLALRFNAMSEALAEARRREHEFLASVSHELRSPITAIRGYAEAIGDGAVSGDEVNDAVAVIKAESQRLERLVQDVMDLARLGANEFRLEIAVADLASIIEETVRAHAGRATEAGIALVSDAPEPIPLPTDPARVRQILTNLVENALRVTPRDGEVRVAGRMRDGRATIEVRDTGPGIAASDLPHVFERAYLWARSRGEREVGTGLGLAIVRGLADALGARLEVTSRPGETSFSLTFPGPD